MKDGLKIVTIGGGSSYTPEIIEGFIDRYESLPVKELWLVDIEEGKEKLEIVGALAKRMIEKAGVRIDLHLSLDRREALKDADFVTTQIRVGQIDARIKDERIPLELGMIGQETNGAGGMFKALRTVPVILDIIKDMEELCPDAWMINFSNPAGMITESAINVGGWKKAIGLCNAPIGMQMEVGKYLGVDYRDVQMEILGLNHHYFATDFLVDGLSQMDKIIDLYTGKTTGPITMKNIDAEKFSDEFIRAIRAIPNPYIKYYVNSSQMLKDELEAFKTNTVRAEEVKRIEHDLMEKYKDPNLCEKPKELELRGGAYYSLAACELINSIYNDKSDIQYVNTLNGDAIDNFDSQYVIECAAKITKDGPIPLRIGKGDYKLMGTINTIKTFEKMTVEAAVSGDRDLAIAALTLNPLVPSEDLAIKVFDKLLEAHKEYLPRFCD